MARKLLVIVAVVLCADAATAQVNINSVGTLTNGNLTATTGIVIVGSHGVKQIRLSELLNSTVTSNLTLSNLFVSGGITITGNSVTTGTATNAGMQTNGNITLTGTITSTTGTIISLSTTNLTVSGQTATYIPFFAANGSLTGNAFMTFASNNALTLTNGSSVKAGGFNARYDTPGVGGNRWFSAGTVGTEMVGIYNASPHLLVSGNGQFTGTLRGAFSSSDGTLGITGTATAGAVTLTIKNGIITGSF